MKNVEQLFEQYGTMVYRLALSCLGSQQDAEDVTQTVFLRAMEKMPSMDENGRKAWLCRVTVNAARDIQRSYWRKNRRTLTVDIPILNEESRGVMEAILRLPEKYRLPVHLHYVEGFSTAEIATQLKLSQTAVTTRLQRARAMLKTELEESKC